MKSRGRSPVPVRATKTTTGSKSVSSSDHDEIPVLSVPSMEDYTHRGHLHSNDSFSALSPSHRLNTDEASLMLKTPTGSGNTTASDLGNSIFYDDPDYAASLSDPELTQKAIEHIQNKIVRTKEQIRGEQTTRDENVNEYLKLSSNADKQQSMRIKQVFEKKNQKSAQSIAQLQRKLEDYQKKVKELEERGLPPKTGLKKGLKNVGDTISGMSSTVMSKPKEFAHLLRHKFGSADNLSTMSKESGDATGEKRMNHTGSASLPREGSGGGASLMSSTERQNSLDSHGKRKCISDDGGRRSEGRSVQSENTSESGAPPPVFQLMSATADGSPNHGGHNDSEAAAQATVAATETNEWNTMIQELALHKEEVDHLREEIDELRQHSKQMIEALSYQLREERDRYERLEEQMNDLTELHQHEIENIKSGVNDMEEKVQYQSEERLLDIKEHLQSLETKITSMEHQQAQQQYLNIEGLDSVDARAILMKFLTALITVIHVVLFFLGTIMNLAKPFLQTTTRALFTTVLVVVASWFYYQGQDVHVLFHRIKSLKNVSTKTVETAAS